MTPPRKIATRQLYDGAAYQVLAYARSHAACQVTSYLNGLEVRDRKRITALLKRTAQHGPPRNDQKCHKVAGEDLWEFKASQQRIFWCYDPARRERIILLHGFTKKDPRTPRQELEAGRRAYHEVHEALSRKRGRKK